MNLPVTSTLVDSTLSSANTISSLKGKGSASFSAAQDGSAATSFDQVFSNVEDAPSSSGSSAQPASSLASTGSASSDDTSAVDQKKASDTDTDSDDDATDIPGTVKKKKKAASAKDVADPGPAPVATSPATGLPVLDEIAAALAASAVAVSAPAIQTVDTSGNPPSAAIADGTLVLSNGKGRSVAEMLAQSTTTTLDYSLTASGADTAASSSVGKTTGRSTKEPVGAGMDPKAAANNALANDLQVDAASTDQASVANGAALSQALNPVSLHDDAAKKAILANGLPSDGTATTNAAASATATAAAKTEKTAKVATAVNGASDSTVSSPDSKAIPGTVAASEKFADGSGQQNQPGDDSSNRSPKNTHLAANHKVVTNMSGKVGTNAAIGSISMTSNPHVPATTALSGNVLASASSSAVGTTSDVHAVAVSHAATLVHQINDIADGLWSVDRQSVEVNFNFGEKEKLSVRVEYKDGQVQTTFNTSSTELRTAITQAWNSQNSSPDARSYKMADPVFTNASSGSFSSNSNENSSSSSRQFDSFQNASNSGGVSRSRSSSSAVSVSASTSPRTSLRPEVAGHLNALV